jgi:ribosomal protein L44E
MSGIDEQDIPLCPKCKKNTSLWRLYRFQVNTSNHIACFNIELNIVKRYGEFNVFGNDSEKKYNVRTATMMVCDSCGLRDDGMLLKRAKMSFMGERKRYPEIKERRGR